MQRFLRETLPFPGAALDEELRLLYVGMTRSTATLILSAAGDSAMVQRVRNSLQAVQQQFGTESGA